MNIPPMTEAVRALLRRYGNHTRTCAWEQWHQNSSLMMGYDVYSKPDCDCGWLEVLQAACGPEEEVKPWP